MHNLAYTTHYWNASISMKMIFLSIFWSWVDVYIHVTVHHNRFLFNNQQDALII